MDTGRYIKLRTAVVVCSMVIMPAAAVFGLKSPPAPGEKPARETAARPAANESATGARTISSASPRPVSGPERVDVPAPGSVASSSGFPVAPATTNIDVHGASADQVLSGRVTVAGGAEANHDQAAQPASFSQSAAQAGQSLPDAVPSRQSPQEFSQIQSRLRSLGATYYALETWGTNGQLFRFQCRMAAGHDPGYTRQFEATDTDPLLAMQTVLSEVEAWKAGRLP